MLELQSVFALTHMAQRRPAVSHVHKGLVVTVLVCEEAEPGSRAGVLGPAWKRGSG